MVWREERLVEEDEEEGVVEGRGSLNKELSDRIRHSRVVSMIVKQKRVACCSVSKTYLKLNSTGLPPTATLSLSASLPARFFWEPHQNKLDVGL